MVIVNGHFDGKTIVLDEPLSLRLASGTRLKIRIETIDETPAVTFASRSFQPLNVQIAPDLSNAIALDPEFNIEES